MHQQRADGSTTFNARAGQITKRDEAPILILRHGSSQSFSTQGVLNYLAFDEYALDLSPYLSKADAVHFKTSDRYLHELVFPDLTQTWEREYRLKLLSEANSRLASPLYSITLMAIALAAVLGGSFSRLGYNHRIAAAGGVAALVRILGFAAQAMAVHSPWWNLLQYVLPVGAAGLALGALFRRPAASRRPRYLALAGAGA